MTHFCTHHIPRAHVDPIDSEWDALAVISLAMGDPPHDEIIAVLLDSERRGFGIVVVSGPPDADGIFAVIDVLTSATIDRDDAAGLVLASCRVGGGIEPGDAERWMEASDQCESAGLELVEWFVIGEQLSCPRDLIGEPPRWGRG